MELHDVDLGENVQIMPGAELANTTIDDSVVFPDATLRDCDVRRSLVDENTLVEFTEALRRRRRGAHQDEREAVAVSRYTLSFACSTPDEL